MKKGSLTYPVIKKRIIGSLTVHEKLSVDWSGRRRLQREKHELKTPQTSLLVEETEAMPAESVRL